MNDTHPFVAYLFGLAEREDRAALAELRRGFINELAVLPHVVPFLARDASRWEEDGLALVGKLFALHPERGQQSLASALRVVAATSDSVELRFRALLVSDREDLGVHLRHAVSLVRARALAIDWNDLLRTIRGWNANTHWAQRNWARDFWGARSVAEQEAEEEP